MASIPDETLQAEVLWWNTWEFVVRCPFCRKEEWNSFGGAPLVDDPDEVDIYEALKFISLCNKGLYICQFPFDEINTGYEIDRLESRFITAPKVISSTLDESSGDTIDTLANLVEFNLVLGQVNDRLLFVMDAKEISTLVAGMFTLASDIPDVSDAMRTLSTGSVEEFNRIQKRQSWQHNTWFVQGRDTRGNTALINASPYPNTEMIVALLLADCDIHAVNQTGRNALMEAALWGQLGTVELLLEHGALATLQDSQGQTALDLVQATPANAVERLKRMEQLSSYVDDLEEIQYRTLNSSHRDEDRNQISQLLRGDPRLGKPPTNDFFQMHPEAVPFEKLKFLISNSYYDYGKDQAIASLYRGRQFEVVSALSGWSPYRPPDGFISGKKWTDAALKLAKSIDYALPKSYASHVEKQLIAYFLDRHVFMPTKEKFDDLSSFAPPVLLLDPFILVNKECCGDCLKFV